MATRLSDELTQDSLSNQRAREMVLKIIFYAQAEMSLQFY